MIPVESVKEQTKTAAAEPKREENPLLRNFEVSLSKEELEKEREALAAQYSQTVKMSGFRQGKVPLDVIKSTYKKTLTDDVIAQALNRLASQHIERENFRVVGQPSVEKIDYEEGQDLKAALVVEVLPEILLPQMATVEVQVPTAELKGEEYDEEKQINFLLDANKRSVPVKDRGIEEGDLALLKIQSRIVESRKMTPAKDFYFAVKKDMESEILDLYPELLGRRREEKITLKRTYPADFGKKTWAGKEVEHFVEVKSIFEWKKPSLDADFLKAVSIPSEEELRKKLREEFDHNAGHKREETAMKFIFDRLAALIQFPIPKSLVDREIARQLSENRRPLNFRDDEEKEQFKQLLIRNAEKSVQVSLIVDEIRRQHRIEISQEDIEKEYRHLAGHHNLPEKDVRKYYADKEKLEQLKDQLLDTKVIQWIKDKVKIKEV